MQVAAENTPMGYASNPDSARAHSHVDQNEWLHRSAAVINEFLQRLPGVTAKDASVLHQEAFQNFSDAYHFLAKQRHQIAADLGHGAQFKRTDDYGTLRPEHYECRETFYEADVKQACISMKDSVYTHMKGLIKKIEEENKSGGQHDYLGGNDDYGFRKMQMLTEDQKAFTLYEIFIKSPHRTQAIDRENHSTRLSTLYLCEYVNPADSKFNQIRFEYTSINTHDLKGDFNLANRYFTDLLNITKAVDKKSYKFFRHATDFLGITETEDKKLGTFLVHAGRLSHLLAHLLPVKLGNAGIMEWMIRGLAFKKGIYLGPFSYADGLSWDFKALLTPNREEYANWYAEHAFAYTRHLTQEEIDKGFSYDDSPSKKEVAAVSPTQTAGTFFSMQRGVPEQPAEPESKSDLSK